MKETLAKDLKLGDVISVRPEDDEIFTHGTVVEITTEYVEIVRPYIHLADFTYSDKKVLNYVGTERWKLFISDPRPVWVVAHHWRNFK